jgi:hypothetical protein
MENRMGGTCSAYGEGRSVYRVLVGKAERKRFRRRLEDIIGMGFSGIGIWGYGLD